MNWRFPFLAFAQRSVLVPVALSLFLARGCYAAGQALPSTDGLPITTAWMVNTSGTLSPTFNAPVDVQSVAVDQSSVRVTTQDIPSYVTTITPSILASLESRSTSGTDFRSGQPAVQAGRSVAFGQDIGYQYTTCTGNAAGGAGYWPAGGAACATPQSHSYAFPLHPTPALTSRATNGGEIGLWVNGVSVFNWSDAQTYRNQGVWHRTALVWEGVSMDICSGHSAQGDYHSHTYPNCLAAQLNDGGQGHSPIYGFAADGYPIYGPWTSAGVLAKSGWKVRDYETAGSPTGCGGSGQRTCLLVDQANPGKGTVDTSQPGPTTSAISAVGPGYNVQAVPGAFAEDYFYDRSCADCLDEHNGHDDGDGLGYHYTISVTQAPGGSLVPAFPYILGLTYAGELPGNSFALRPGPPVRSSTGAGNRPDRG